MGRQSPGALLKTRFDANPPYYDVSLDAKAHKMLLHVIRQTSGIADLSEQFYLKGTALRRSVWWSCERGQALPYDRIDKKRMSSSSSVHHLFKKNN